MLRSTAAIAAGMLALLLVPGCATYREKPLVSEAIIEQMEVSRREPEAVMGEPSGGPVSFAQAAVWLKAQGPEVREAVAAYETALARAGQKTPLPNPGLEIGPQFGFGPDQGVVNRWAPFGSIGFAIPLSKRLRRQDELNRALAEVARVEALARHRELYLELRERYTELVLARQRLLTQTKLVEDGRRALDTTRKQLEAGQATTLDVNALDLELAQSQSAELAARQESAKLTAELSRMTGAKGTHFELLPDDALPLQPDQPPSIEELKTLLIQQHGQLARLRAKYGAAERGLRLEVSKQFPDLRIGPSFSSESGEKRTVTGLALGIDLPLFDRNQQSIAEAGKHRDEVRIQYEAAANRALADLDAALAGLELACERARLLKSRALPLAEAQIKLARKAVDAGDADGLRVIDAERSYRRMLLETSSAEWDERRAWVALERAVGCPLLRFPGETAAPEAPVLLQVPGQNKTEGVQEKEAPKP